MKGYFHVVANGDQVLACEKATAARRFIDGSNIPGMAIETPAGFIITPIKAVERKRLRGVVQIAEGLTISKAKELIGAETHICMAKMFVNSKKINITYDFLENNLVVHEWYKLGRETSEYISGILTDFFKTII